MLRRTTLCSFLLAVLVSACASPPTMITSLEDLTSETQRQGLTDVNQNRILSITGLLPHAQVGSLYRYKRKRSPSTSIGIGEDTSFFVESVIPPEDPAALRAVKDKILDARLRARQSLTKLLALNRARAALAAAQRADPPPDNLSTLQQAVVAAETAHNNARDLFDQALNAASKELKTTGLMVIRWDTSKGSEGALALGNLFGARRKQGEEASGFAILSGLRLVTLFVAPDIWQAQVPVRETWKLYGPDFPYVFNSRPPFLGQWRLRDLRVTTHLLQVQHVEYLQDMVISEEFEASLSASYSELQNLGDALEELDKIEVDYVREQLSSLSNMGSIAGIERRVYPSPFDPAKRALIRATQKERSGAENFSHDDIEAFAPGLDAACELITGRCLSDQLQADAADADRRESLLSPPMKGWQTVYAVDTDFESLRDLFKRP